MSLTSALDLPIARNLTGLLQLMQRLVGPEEHRHWCGGTMPVVKFPAFLHKMEQRYPVLRTTRERSYDRQRGRAVTHMIIYPIGHRIGDQARGSPVHELHTALMHDNTTARDRNQLLRPSTISWWLVSSTGTGGLADPTMPDAHVARDAMHADGHITVGDYVLLFATKKEPRSILDSRTGHSRRIFKDVSTWTWKLRSEVFREVRGSIDECCASLNYGTEPTWDHAGSGLRGLLAAQRARPLFAGLRNQVVDLHRYAHDVWETRRRLYVSAHPERKKQHGTDDGALRPINEILKGHLPKMIRLRVYDDPPCRVCDLLPADC
jgi:hypothetical protein